MNFHTLLQLWRSFAKGAATLNQTEDFIKSAETGHDIEPWEWTEFAELLEEKGGCDPKRVVAIVRVAKVKSVLRAYPNNASDFIPLWLTAFGFTMSFDGVFHNNGYERDTTFVLNEMDDWCSTYAGSQKSPLFTSKLTAGALMNWTTKRREELIRDAYRAVKFDASADKAQLTAFATYVTKPTGDRLLDDLRVKATEIALANFIYRVKNHMRGRWKHSCHLMPIFHGPQGSSKTTAIDALLAPVADVTAKTDFEVFSHDSKAFDLTIKPIMFMDEMSGATRADVTKIKQVMTQDRRSMRQIYQATSTRTLITTFVGASNKDISTLIKDETGNRRFLQIDTPVLDRKSFAGFDMLAVWRSVDENAEEPPLYATPEATEIVKAVQDGQRFRGPVYEWVMDEGLPAKATVYTELFNSMFRLWLECHAPGELRFMDAKAMKSELERLIEAGDLPGAVMTMTGNRRHFRSDATGIVKIAKPELTLASNRDAA